MAADKYNMREDLLEKDKEYQGSSSMLGRTILTFPQYNNSTRSTMHTTHQQQFKVQLKADSPGFFTNAENLVGKYSDGYKKVDGECEVFRKIVKFEGLVEKPTVYKLFYYDKKKKRFDVETRKDCENLSEVYGYQYNNDGIDSFEEGDIIPEGTVLYKSTSYDAYMNYGFGKDILTMYKNLGGEILTIGSDSHNPSQVAFKFDEVYERVKNIGFKYICTFDKMKPNFIKL